MFKNQEILCVIPARGGSKRLPRKNVKLLHGRPLIEYAISAAKASRNIDRIIVVTDDEEIANVARGQDVEVPQLLPAELTNDTAKVVPAIQYTLRQMQEREAYNPETLVLIQPTSPFVQGADVDVAIEKFFETGANSCVSVCEVTDRPEWMYYKNADRLTPYITSTPSMLRQDMPQLFRLNGAVYVAKMDLLMKKNQVYDNESCAAIVMPQERSLDIDTSLDFTIAEALIAVSTEN